MVAERYEFHPEGDVVFRLTYPAEKHEPPKDQDDGYEVVNDTTGDKFDSASSETSVNNHFPAEEVDMLVSSAHLKLASPVFKAMLQVGGFKEGKTLHTIGKVEISLPDDDLDAFELLMNIVHNKTRRIPRQIEMGRLTSLSTLADKYQLAESLELCVDIWLPTLRPSRPRVFTPEVLPWLSLSWIFNLADDFKHLTQIAIIESDSRLEAPLGTVLPFPNSVIAEIEEQRQSCIRSVLSAIQAQINLFSGPNSVCSFQSAQKSYPFQPFEPSPHSFTFGSPPPQVKSDGEDVATRRSNCDGMMLGTFLKNASGKNLWPLPLWPYKGLNLATLVSEARTIKTISLCHARDPSQGLGVFGSTTEVAHGQDAVLSNRLATIRQGVLGLELDLFKKPSTLKLPVFET